MAALMVKFAVNHPCGAGHFPGNPIIPGALLLDEVLACIATDLDIANGVWRIKSAKFPQPVRPGGTVHIDYTRAANGEIRFAGSVAESKVISGIASYPASESLRS
jgi:3-hydroxyacyl-[acyl-carrier-protein] dehydratase